MRRALIVFCVGALFCVLTPASELCPSWSDGEPVGVLDSRLVPEASGLAASQDGTRLYHINDSGGGPYVYASGSSGGDLERLRLGGVTTVLDTEALTRGVLRGESVLIVGDIGDNQLRRRAIDFFAIRESDVTSDLAPVSRRVVARYPNRPHNAEALAMGPDGSIYLFTKSWSERSHNPASSRVYRLPPSAWESAEPVTLSLLGEIDLPALATRERAPFSDVVTDASMSADGSRFLLLTYGYAWEFALDLSAIPRTSELQRGRDYQVIRLQPILGKETITYLPGDRSFLYGKELKPDSKPSTLIRMVCLSFRAASASLR